MVDPETGKMPLGDSSVLAKGLLFVIRVICELLTYSYFGLIPLIIR